MWDPKSVIGEPKWDLRIDKESIKGPKTNPPWVLKYLLNATLPLSAVAHHYSTASHLRLTLTHLRLRSIADKAALLTFPDRNIFLAGEDSG